MNNLAVGTTSNYSAIVNLHTLRITAANSKSPPACSVFTNLLLVPPSNSGDSSASALTSLPPVHCLTTELGRVRITLQPPISSSWRQAPWDSRPAIIFQLNSCGHRPYVTSSLTTGWICRLQLLRAFDTAVILRAESRGTHNHSLLSQFRDSPNLKGQVTVFISPRNRAAQL
jgi:hypothetical protein